MREKRGEGETSEKRGDGGRERARERGWGGDERMGIERLRF